MEIWSTLAKCCLSGVLVCAFAMLAEIVQPKRFAGLFAAAPSVLTASLAITLLSQGATTAQRTAQGAIAGAVGLIAYCLLAETIIRRLNALRGSLVAVSVWAVAALGAYGLLARVVGG